MSEDQASAGLATVGDVEALADQLSASADALHKRLIKDIKAHQGAFSDAEQAVFRALYDDEQLLRQRAESLYADAAAAVLPLLGAPQQRIMALTAAAADKIRTIGKIGATIGLVGALLSLAGSAVSGNLGGVLDAVEALKRESLLLSGLAGSTQK